VIHFKGRLTFCKSQNKSPKKIRQYYEFSEQVPKQTAILI